MQNLIDNIPVPYDDRSGLDLFLDECVKAAPGNEIKFSDAYEIFAAWYKDKISPGGFMMESHKKFGAALKNLGFKTIKKSGRVYYMGVKIQAKEERGNVALKENDFCKDYKKGDKINLSRINYIHQLLMDGMKEISRRGIERGNLYQIFNNANIAGKLDSILYGGDVDSKKNLYTAINQIFKISALKREWITAEDAARELNISMDILWNGFVYSGLVQCISINGEDRISWEDVKIVVQYQKQFPEEFEKFKIFLFSHSNKHFKKNSNDLFTDTRCGNVLYLDDYRKRL